MGAGRKIRRLAAILAIDVVGFSKMMQSDASGLLAALNAVFAAVVRPEVRLNHGRVVKLLGDGALIEFSSAHEALDCAASIQNRMREIPPPYSFAEPLLLRMGLHAGDVLIEGQDIFGNGVNIAARLQAEAEPGGVLLSRTVADLAGGDLPFRLRPEGPRSLKNIANPIETLSIDFSNEDIAVRRHARASSMEVNFCTSKDNQGLAWTSVGDGPAIVKAPNWIGHLELDWRNPGLAHLYETISSRRRLVYFDARGNGLSDWDMELISFEKMVDDLESVFNAAGIRRAPVLALSQGCAIAAAYAARAPERVSAIIMIGGYAVGPGKRNSKKDRQRARAMRALMTASWHDDTPSLRDHFAKLIVPHASLEDRRRYAEDMVAMISPANIGMYREMLDNVDVAGLLGKVQAPCLVLHGRGDRMQPIEQGRKLAAGIANAKFIAYDSDNHLFTQNDPCWPLVDREIHAFLETVG